MYKKSSQSWRKHIDFILLDLVCLQIAYLLAHCIRHKGLDTVTTPASRNLAIILALISIAVSVFMETFKNVLKRGYYMEFVSTLKHDLAVIILLSCYLVATRTAENYSRTVLYLMGILYAVISFIVRIGWKAVLRNRKSGDGKRSLLIVTVDSLKEACVKNILDQNYENFRVPGIAVIDKNRVGENVNGVQVVADRENLLTYIAGEWVDEVFVNVPPQYEEADDVIEQIMDMGVVIHKRLSEKMAGGQKQFVERMGNYTVLTTSINYATQGQFFMKRMLDILGGLVGTIITGILYVIIAPVIKIKSPGPVFFSQVRVGKNGKLFKIYKFRTMYLDAEERKKELMEQNRVKDGMMFKLDFDPRIIGNEILPDGTQKTGFMELCRKYSLDEFPQFLNVLKGDMSLVGTRPPTVDEYRMYQPHHHARLATRPGITGMWQVSGRSNITDFEEVVRLDTEYIRNWSFALDVKILFKTVAVVFKSEGAM